MYVLSKRHSALVNRDCANPSVQNHLIAQYKTIPDVSPCVLEQRVTPVVQNYRDIRIQTHTRGF